MSVEEEGSVAAEGPEAEAVFEVESEVVPEAVVKKKPVSGAGVEVEAEAGLVPQPH